LTVTKRQRLAYTRALLNTPNTIGPADARDHLATIATAERRLTRIAERQCNGYPDAQGHWDEHAAARDDRAWDRWAKRAIAAAEALGWTIRVQGDPRGYILSLHFPDGSSMAPEWA
jgi:hypothetical protein